MVVGTFTWLAWNRVHRAVESAAADRLSAAARQVASMLATTATQFVLEVRTAAGDSLVVAAITAPGAEAARAAHPALGRPVSGSMRLPSRALWTRDCRLITSVGPLAAEARCPESPAMRAGHVGAFRPQGDSVLVDITAPVLGAGGDTLGFVSEARRIVGSGANPIGRLLGEGVSVRIGNPQGSFWTDLLRPVPGPRGAPPRGRLVEGVDAWGESMFRVAVDVPGADWIVMVQIPHAATDAAVRGLVPEMLLMALACILVGAIGAYLISRYVTAPFTEVERAARGIAAGDYSRRASVDRNDEFGRLARSFNVMAERVAAAHALLEDLVACAPVGVATVDRQLRFVLVNEAMAALSGRPHDTLPGNAPADVEPAMGELLEPILAAVIDAESPVLNRRLAMLAGDGAKRHWIVTAFPVRDAIGAVSGAGVIVVDVTAHEELEARYLQAQKMDAVGRLAGGVAHDFNNLLTVILSYSVMAIDTLPRGSTLRGDLEEIRDAGERAAGLTKQLLAFSRNSVLQPRVVNVNDVAERMERMLRRLLGEDIRLELALAADLARVHADPGQLEQVIMNLAVNSRDAMPEGGRLVIETGNVLLPTVRAAGFGTGATEYVMLTVRDEGVGMSLEVQSHLFEPFFTTKEPGQGTGLGLATVYGIVTQSGGEIHVTSSPGAGTTVTIYLPRATDDAVVAAGNAARAAGGGSETVLLVEDDAALQALGMRVLRRAGYNVLGAATPEAALEIGRRYDGEIDLLLTDIVMPGMNGGTVADELAKLRPGLHTLYMSGYPDEEIVRRGVVADGSAFIQKPFTPAELARRVREALDARTTQTV